MSAIALTHIALLVANPSASAAFYRRFCGLEIQHRRVDPDPEDPQLTVEVIWLANHDALPGFVIVLMQGHPLLQERPSFHHLGFDLASRAEVDALAREAEAEGLLVLPPQDAGPIVGYLCVLRDPDGNWVEVSHGQVIRPPDESV